MRMAEQSTSSSSTGSRKRHKPIEPPSPEPSSRRHHLPLNSGDQQFFQRPQRYSSSTTSTSAASGYRNLNDLGSTHELRTKASVFDRLGGNVVRFRFLVVLRLNNQNSGGIFERIGFKKILRCWQFLGFCQNCQQF